MRANSTMVTLIAIAACSLTTDSQAEEPLRYSPKAGATHKYEVSITAVLGDTTDKMNGPSTFTIKSNSGDQIGLRFYGRVTSSKTSKSSARPSLRGPRGPRGPSFGRRPVPTGGPRGLFESTPYKGLTNTSNELLISTQGGVKSLTGDSQLPYLLGNLSLLIFEPLPDQFQKTWEVERGFLISEEKEVESSPFRFRPSSRFGPRGPFAESEKEEEITAGSQVESYAVKSDDGKLVTITKNYKAKSAETNDGHIEITGSGTWVFNREVGMPESLNLKQELVVSKKNVRLKIPMTVSYRRLSEEELKKLAEEEKKADAERAKRQEEALAKAKAEGRTIPDPSSLRSRREQPLSDGDKKEILKMLKDSDYRKVVQGLQKLQLKSPPTIDDDVKSAIQPLLKHENRLVQMVAERLEKKWPLDTTSPAKAVASNLRTWTDSSSTFSVEAAFVRLADNKVTLRKKDGKELNVPLDRLSESDQNVVKQLSAKGPSNPFE